MSGWQDPDDPRQWYLLVPLLVFIVVVAALLAVAGQWTVLALIAAATAVSAWAAWQAGKPLWPGGPRRRA